MHWLCAGAFVWDTAGETQMSDKTPEEIQADKLGAERAAAHKEMKMAQGTSAHDAAVKKHTAASEAHAKALIMAQKAATKARK